jgi:hypothetical protein
LKGLLHKIFIVVWRNHGGLFSQKYAFLRK